MTAKDAITAIGGFGGLATLLLAFVAYLRLPSERGTAAVTQAQGAATSLKNAADSWEALATNAEHRAARLGERLEAERERHRVELERQRTELEAERQRCSDLEAELADCRRGHA